MSFYHSDLLNAAPVSFPDASKMLKKDMTLNLSDDALAHVKPHHLEGNGLLNSPDMGLMNLASLDLERLIQSNAMAATSPAGGHCLYPKMPMVEQEFTDGFVMALEDLHKQNQLNGGGGMKMGSGPTGASVHPPEPSHSSVYVTLNNYVNDAVAYNPEPVSYPPLPTNMAQESTYPTHRPHDVKDEPQRVPEVTSFGDSPPLSPINMDNQERIKAERKKLRNRIAASKCRKRKLERISRLEEKVKNLKTQNTDLASAASVLRKQVAQLKQKVMSHVNSGCQLLPYHVQAY